MLSQYGLFVPRAYHILDLVDLETVLSTNLSSFRSMSIRDERASMVLMQMTSVPNDGKSVVHRKPLGGFIFHSMVAHEHVLVRTSR